jgi:predicted nucleotidyltransferase
MLSANEIIKFLKKNKTYLQKHFYCSEIGLFGSFARNEQTEQSDIDILVEFEPGTPDLYHVELELKEYLKKSFNREIDICTKKWIKPIFRPLVLKEAIYA